MRRGKFHKRKNRFPAVLLAVLILTVVGASFGGVRAYLSTSTGAVTNSFSNDIYPTITVDDDTKVTVSGINYAVYLRAAVVINWKSSNGNILATVPTGYTLTPGDDWVPYGGFYYYTKPVTAGNVIPPVINTLTAPVEGQSGYEAGYTLVSNVAVQAIQAVGSTDVDDISAVENAWGITPAQITGSGS